MFNKTTLKWIAITADGKKISGKTKTLSREKLSLYFQKNQLTPMLIKQTTLEFSRIKKCSSKDRLDFTQQLQLLLKAGLPLADTLSLIAKTTNRHMQILVESLNQKITTGMPLSHALRDFPKAFDNTFCQLIYAGEQSNNLDIVLTQLVDNQKNRVTLQNKIKKTLFYPIAIMMIAFLVCIGLLIFVIPQFSQLYQNFGAKLPAATQYLILASHLLIHQGMFYLLGIIFLIPIIKKILWKSVGAIFNRFFLSGQIAQWSQLLAMTLSANIPMVDALPIANEVFSDKKISNQMKKIKWDVIAGSSLHSALMHCDFFPERAKTMISIGENADALPLMMNNIAHIFQQEFDDHLDRLSKLIEPVMMMVVASFVSSLIIAMYLPIFKMGSIV